MTETRLCPPEPLPLGGAAAPRFAALLAVVAIGLAALGGGVAVDAPLNPQALRIVPHPGGGWRVLFRGAPALFVDDAPYPATGAVVLDAERPHRLRVGQTTAHLPARADVPTAVRLLVIGDGRAAVDGLGPSAYWPGMLDEALALGPGLLLNTGDLVKRGADPREWRRYIQRLPPWPPMVAVRGNHDRGALFDVYSPGLGEVFSWRWGPIRLFGLDTEGTDEEVRARLGRLDALMATPEVDEPWRVLMMHRPVWSRGNHGSDERRLNAELVPLIDARGVDLALAGHDHNYERFCASRGHGAQRRCVREGEGTVYVVTGGAATFTNPVPGVSRKVDPATAAQDRAASRAYSGAHHFLVLEADPQRLRVVAWRTRTGNVRPPGPIDEFTLRRAQPRAHLD